VAQKISIDTPLAELTLRKYERPTEGLGKRDLVRKLCLSLGLLQPGDSRDVIVDVLQVVLEAEKELTSTEVEKRVVTKRKEQKLELLGIAPSNIRRQLLRLRDIFLVEKVKNTYRIRENAKLKTISKRILRSIISIVSSTASKSMSWLQTNCSCRNNLLIRMPSTDCRCVRSCGEVPFLLPLFYRVSYRFQEYCRGTAHQHTSFLRDRCDSPSGRLHPQRVAR
jgi:hypothetical protein